MTARDGEVLRLRRRPDGRVQIDRRSTDAAALAAAIVAADADAAVDAAPTHQARRLRVKQLPQGVEEHAPAAVGVGLGAGWVWVGVVERAGGGEVGEVAAVRVAAPCPAPSSPLRLVAVRSAHARRLDVTRVARRAEGQPMHVESAAVRRHEALGVEPPFVSVECTRRRLRLVVAVVIVVVVAAASDTHRCLLVAACTGGSGCARARPLGSGRVRRWRHVRLLVCHVPQHRAPRLLHCPILGGARHECLLLLVEPVEPPPAERHVLLPGVRDGAHVGQHRADALAGARLARGRGGGMGRTPVSPAEKKTT